MVLPVSRTAAAPELEGSLFSPTPTFTKDVEGILASSDDAATKDITFLHYLREHNKEQLVTEFPIIHTHASDSSGNFSCVFDNAQQYYASLLSFSRKRVLADSYFPKDLQNDNILNTINEYLHETISYQDVYLPKACRTLSDRAFQKYKMVQATKTVQNFIENLIRTREFAYATNEILPVTHAKRRYVLALMPERAKNRDWLPHLENALCHDKVVLAFATKSDKALIGGSLRLAPQAKSHTLFPSRPHAIDNTHITWSYGELTNTQVPSHLQQQLDRQMLVVVAARFICSNPANEVEKEKERKLIVLKSDQISSSSSSSSSSQKPPQSIAQPLTSVTQSLQSLSLHSEALNKQMGPPPHSPGQSTAIMPATNVPHTHIGVGSTLKASSTASKSTVPQLLDRESAELILIKVVQVRCPDSIDQLPTYLQLLSERIREYQKMMLDYSLATT